MAAVYRTDHVGSMVRPTRLMDAREAHLAGTLSLEALRQVEDECILEALELQRQAGVAVFTDGEMRRHAYTTDLYEAAEGFQEEYPVVEREMRGGGTVLAQMHTKPVVGKIRPL